MINYENNYAPLGKFLWDPWFIDEGGIHHLFHLQADIAANFNRRNISNISIGHAISKDLVNWEQLPTVLKPGGVNEWDNKNLWSGCAARKDNTFYIYYTGENSNPSVSNIQKIGVAISKDLNIWTKYDKNPILEADPRYYQMDNNKNVLGNVGAWRDPFVFKDQYSDSRYMTISARENTKGIKYNACVALAQSDDMINWNILPPIFSPGIYDEIEVTRIIYHNGYYYLFFTTYGRNYEPEFAKQHGAHDGLHCYYSDNLFGGYKPINGNGVVFDNGHDIYDVRVLNLNGNDFVGIGWLNRDSNGDFIGKLASPVKIRIEGGRVYKIE